MTFEEKLHNIENELVELYFQLKEIVENMDKNYPSGHSSRPDYRYLENRLNELKYLICNNFGYCPHEGSISKNPQYRPGEAYSLMNAMKLAEKYKK